MAELEGVDPAEVPADAVTASGSGLDNGHLAGVRRTSRSTASPIERGVAPSEVEALVAAATVGRDLGFIGAPYVNVLELNLALDRELP